MKNVVGRPAHTLEYMVQRGIWKEDWKDNIMEIGKEGGHKSNIMEKMNLSRQTFYKLYNNHPEFTHIVDKAMILSQNHWMNMVKDSFEKGESRNINAGLWQFLMKNMHPSEFTDSKSIDVTSQGQKINDDKNITVRVIPPKDILED